MHYRVEDAKLAPTTQVGLDGQKKCSVYVARKCPVSRGTSN